MTPPSIPTWHRQGLSLGMGGASLGVFHSDTIGVASRVLRHQPVSQLTSGLAGQKIQSIFSQEVWGDSSGKLVEGVTGTSPNDMVLLARVILVGLWRWRWGPLFVKVAAWSKGFTVNDTSEVSICEGDVLRQGFHGRANGWGFVLTGVEAGWCSRGCCPDKN